MQVLQQQMFGIVQVYNKLMNTSSMIASPSIILLQPHVGRFHASDLYFLPTSRQCLAIKWGYGIMQVLQQQMFGIVQVYNKLMNTSSMIASPSIILLQPHVGRFHASDLYFLPTSRQCLAIKWGYDIMQVLQQWLFGIVWVYNKLMKTPGMIISPSIILLQLHVGRFHV